MKGIIELAETREELEKQKRPAAGGLRAQFDVTISPIRDRRSRRQAL